MRTLLLALVPLTIWVAFAQEQRSQPIQANPLIDRSSTPIYELLAYRPASSTHISELDDELIVAQIATFEDEDQARLFLKNHSTIYISGMRIQDGDDIKFVVYIGLYEDDDTARWAHESFAERNPRFLTTNFKRVRLGDLKANIVDGSSSADATT